VRQSQTDQPLGQLIRCQFLTTVRVSMDATARLALRAVNLDGFVWACPDASRRNTNAQSLRDMTLQEKIDKAAVSVILALGLQGEPSLLDLRHPDADVPLDQADDHLIPGDTQLSVSAPKSVKIFLRSIVKVFVTESFAKRPLGSIFPECLRHTPAICHRGR
jgi:hypothetical protein